MTTTQFCIWSCCYYSTLISTVLTEIDRWLTPFDDSGWCIAHCKKKKFGCFNRWVVTLVARDGGVERFNDLVTEVNCISNMSLNYTLQLTTLRTPVSESLQLTAFQKHNAFVMILRRRWVVTISTKLLHALWYVQVWLLSKMHDQCRSGGFLSGCLMHLATHNHLLLSLPATTVTILWLKQPICFCSACMQGWFGEVSKFTRRTWSCTCSYAKTVGKNSQAPSPIIKFE